jgi:hypothetical protein
MKKYCLLFLITMSLSAAAQQPDTVFLKNLLLAHPELFSGILNHPTQNEYKYYTPKLIAIKIMCRTLLRTVTA